MKKLLIAAVLAALSIQATAYDPNSCDFKTNLVAAGAFIHAQGSELDAELRSMQKGMDKKGFDENLQNELIGLAIYGYQMADKGYDGDAVLTRYRKSCEARK